jgi:hypothetical protein
VTQEPTTGVQGPEAEPPEPAVLPPPTVPPTAPPTVPPTAPPTVPPTAPWLRASSARVRIAAVVVAVAALTAVLVTVVHSGSSQPVYSSLPAPCALVSPATVAKYLPNATRSPESMFASNTYQAGSCKWASSTGGDDRTLVAQAFVFDSSSSVAAARQAYDNSLSAFGCHCQGVTVSTQSVTGLGDQAAVFYIADGPAATVATAPNAAFPGTSLLVRSSNAEIALNYDATAPATGTALAPATGTAQLTGLISMAQDILDALAQPSAVASVPFSPEPHYARPPDPCSLITTATLATYAPGAAVKPQPAADGSGSPRTVSCSWGSKSNSVLLTLSSFQDATSARQSFDIDALANSRTISGETVTGSVWMPDLGEEAAAIFQTRTSSGQGVAMIVWSGNFEISLWYAGTGPTPPDRATLLAGGIAMARDVLAALPG